MESLQSGGLYPPYFLRLGRLIFRLEAASPMGRARNLLLPLALALALSACSSKPQWVKPGTSRDTANDDLEDCQGLARTATRNDQAIDQDILATRGADWERNNMLQAKKSTFAVQDEDHARDIIASCMSGKGYTPARKS